MEKMNKKELKRIIQSSNFAMLEIALFLDTHPDNQQALEAYHMHQKTLLDSISLYEEKFGPLTNCGVNSYNYWNWVKEPWPWQKECE